MEQYQYDTNYNWIIENCEKDGYSQCNEGGIIRRILQTIGYKNRYCLEVGAYDGQFLSNTYFFRKNENFESILIEGDKDKYIKLLEDCRFEAKMHPVLRLIEPTGENSIDRIVGLLSAPTDMDLMSIDIDGEDYAVFEALQCKPRVIVVEYEHTNMGYCKRTEHRLHQAGMSAVATLGIEKGYTPICMCGVNVIFADSIYAEDLKVNNRGKNIKKDKNNNVKLD